MLPASTRRSGLLLAALALSACQATDPAFLSPAGRLVAEIEAIPYRVALAPVQVETGLELQGKKASSLPFGLDAKGLQTRLLAELRRQNTSTEVFAVGTEDLAQARQQRADLLLRPRVTAVELGYQGSGADAWLSAGLWLGTWAGGLFSGDSRYRARLEVEWRMVSPFDNSEIDSLVCTSEQADLSFFQRNSPFSLGLFQTLVLPPVWTSDNAARTADSLTRLATARVAARLAMHLKSEFQTQARQVAGQLRIDAPRNGSDCGARARLRGRVIAPAPITAIHIYLNDQPVLLLKDDKLPDPVAQSRGATFQVPLDHSLPLAPGPNQIAIEFAVRGRFSSRTLLVHNRSNQEKQ